MTARELRQKYLDFFQSKGHSVYPSGSLIPYDVTGRLDESLLFNGAGMVQFKPFFRGIAEPPNRRLTNSQKCVRTGDIEEVGDLTHLTFFEMLGNFSFGDYFKEEAIAYSWEFLMSPEWLGLDPRRLSFTVFEEDDVAYEAWATHLRKVGIAPSSRIFRLGEETNYWPAGAFSAGPPGPCGPNSEMFYWVEGHGEPPGIAEGDYSREDYLRDEKAGKWLEIWNDVFIQFEWKGRLRNPERPADGYLKEGMEPLPFQSVDTGMGLERTITVLNGKQSVYDNDLFEPIFAKLSSMGSGMGVPVVGFSDQGPEAHANHGQDARGTEAARAMRIIADHIRTAVFCIADGVLPGNTGRGYVLRRLIRRAVLKGQRVLGFDRPFFHEVYEGVVEALGDHYSEIVERREVVVETLRNEEALFRRTLASGYDLLSHHLHALDGSAEGTVKVLGGEFAFRLYDTYGFPLEVTQELAEEAGVEVDVEGYEIAMREAQERSRMGSGMETVYGSVTISLSFETEEGSPVRTEFRGYETCQTRSRVLGALQSEGQLVIALDQTPFYAQSGGQVSDEGVIQANGTTFRVLDLHKQDEVYVHLVEQIEGDLVVPPGTPDEEATRILNERLYGREVEAKVDLQRRRSIMRNHTATHLLHAALRQVLGKHVTQAGSYVGPDYLRFDFTHGKAMTPVELASVERIVNERALENTPVATYIDIPIEEAKQRGAMALFGEKYGDRVRMVEVGEFSRELCGGTHVGSTGEIGLFKITSEASAASGIRRIEALTGEAAYLWVLEQSRTVREAAEKLKANPRELQAAIDKTLEQLKEERRRREKAEAAAARASSGSSSAGSGTEYQEVSGVRLWSHNFGEIDQKVAAGAIDDAIAQNPDLVAVGAVVSDGRVSLTCKVGKDAQAKGAHAGNLIREVAKVTGGGGGGKPDFATAGGKDASKVGEALAAASGILQSQLQG
jgi:alanyl-tRNA synthetase